jgi:hypothetical protein
MQNLLERLKPEILEVMEDYNKSYPLVVKELKDELQNLNYVNDIRYQFIIQLETYYLSAFNKFPSNAWENFIEN